LIYICGFRAYFLVGRPQLKRLEIRVTTLQYPFVQRTSYGYAKSHAFGETPFFSSPAIFETVLELRCIFRQQRGGWKEPSAEHGYGFRQSSVFDSKPEFQSRFQEVKELERHGSSDFIARAIEVIRCLECVSAQFPAAFRAFDSKRLPAVYLTRTTFLSGISSCVVLPELHMRYEVGQLYGTNSGLLFFCFRAWAAVYSYSCFYIYSSYVRLCLED